MFYGKVIVFKNNVQFYVTEEKIITFGCQKQEEPVLFI